MALRSRLLALGCMLLAPLAGWAGQLEDCRALRERRDALAAEAMRAEIALVMSVRRRLCPQQEALAERANAHGQEAPQPAAPAGAILTAPGVSPEAAPGAGANPDAAARAQRPAAAAGGDPPADLDYGAYLRCRREAERLLQRSRVVLYTNQQGFLFYTASGARLAREADGLRAREAERCPAPAAAGSPR